MHGWGKCCFLRRAIDQDWQCFVHCFMSVNSDLVSYNWYWCTVVLQLYLLYRGDAVASWLVRSTRNQVVWVRALAEYILLCSWAKTKPLYTGEFNSGEFIAGDNPAMDKHPIQGVYRNTPSHFILRKPGCAPAWWADFTLVAEIYQLAKAYAKLICFSVFPIAWKRRRRALSSLNYLLFTFSKSFVESSRNWRETQRNK